MKKLLSIVVLGSLLAGCGGSSLLGTVTGNSYDGNYNNGSFSITNFGSGNATLSGRATFTILSGNLSGSLTDTSSNPNKNYGIQGTVDTNGNLTNGLVLTNPEINFSGAINLQLAAFSADFPESNGATGVLHLQATRQ